MDFQQYLKFFGHTSFRGCQAEIISRIIAGGHCLVLMPTGMGKSLCYQLPALASPGLTLVISPLIALMKDQVDSLKKIDIDASYINSMLSGAERKNRYAKLTKGHYKILYVTPERFRKAEFIECLSQRQVDILAVDEAHCISQWGHDFRPDYTRLKEIRARIGNPTTIALTATATPDVQKDIIKQLGLKKNDIQIFHEGLERPNLFLRVMQAWDKPDKIDKICKILPELPGNGIIYFSLIKSLEDFSAAFFDRGIDHLCYHGKLDRNVRRKTQETFMQGQGNLILATNAFGMGVDKANIRFVIHAELPGSIESYYQEIGRAGRDGKPSQCIMLYDEQDLLIHMDFIKWNNPDAGLYKIVHGYLSENIEQANSIGVTGVKEMLIKNRGDFRLETVLAILDRHGVTTGNLEQKNLTLCGPLPAQLMDQSHLREKQLREQKMLHQLVLYNKDKRCRKAFIHEYFGLPKLNCQACDLCM